MLKKESIVLQVAILAAASVLATYAVRKIDEAIEQQKQVNS